MDVIARSVRITFACACLAAATCSPVHATGPEPVRVEREISVDGRPLHYVAEADRLPLLHAVTGEARAWIFHTGYRSAAGWGARPITFLWNGGPVSNSVLLHFDGFGPRLVRDGALVDNPHTLLTHSDLVFMDPVGTGYSRAAPGHADDFAGTLGDFAAATQFVRSFLIRHGALDAPVYLAGESYGVWRAAAAAGELAERGIHVAGTILISGGSGTADLLPQLDASAFQVPARSVVAHRHGRLAWADGLAEEDVHAQALEWARTRYLPALRQRESLPAAERQRLREELAHWLGLDADLVDPDTLVVSNRQFLDGLLADSGETLQIFDMRTTGSIPTPDGSAVVRYFRDELGYRSTLPYLGAEPATVGYLAPGEEPPTPIGSRWRYDSAALTPEAMARAMAGGGPPGALPWSIDAARANPELRVLVAAGRFDALNNCDANDVLASLLPAALQPRFRFVCYEGGHMMYHDADTHARMAQDLREFVALAAARDNQDAP